MTQGIFAHWPNRITALRFFGACVLFVLFAVYGDRDPADLPGIGPAYFWLFVVTALTDFLDGWLARRGNFVTAFGRIADPFVDKILVLGSMIFLAVMPWSRAWFPAWIVVVVLSREVLVTAIRGYVESVGGEFPADWFGKVKMVAQCWAIGTVLGLHAFAWSPEAHSNVAVLGHFFVWATLLTSVVSGLTYVFKLRASNAARNR